MNNLHENILLSITAKASRQLREHEEKLFALLDFVPDHERVQHMILDCIKQREFLSGVNIVLSALLSPNLDAVQHAVMDVRAQILVAENEAEQLGNVRETV